MTSETPNYTFGKVIHFSFFIYTFTYIIYV